jgi:hypothetical protein
VTFAVRVRGAYFTVIVVSRELRDKATLALSGSRPRQVEQCWQRQSGLLKHVTGSSYTHFLVTGEAPVTLCVSLTAKSERVIGVLLNVFNHTSYVMHQQV